MASPAQMGAQQGLIEYPLLADAFDRSLRKSVVLITSSIQDNAHFGTGFIIEQSSDSALIVTCAHVVRDVGGIENLLVASRPAVLIADGAPSGIDIAVLSVTGLIGQPLRLRSASQQSSRFRTVGFQAYSKKFLLRPLEGTLGEQVGIQDPSQKEPLPAWDLLDINSQGLRDGYSGSPVIDKRTGDVMGVLSHRQGERAGLAISVEAIATVYQEARVFSEIEDYEEDSREGLRAAWLVSLLLFLYIEVLLGVLGLCLPLSPLEHIGANISSLLLLGVSALGGIAVRRNLHTALLWMRGRCGMVPLLVGGTVLLAGLAVYNHQYLLDSARDTDVMEIALRSANWDVSQVEENLRGNPQMPPMINAFAFSVAARKTTGRAYPEQERLLAEGATRGRPLFTRAIAYLGLANLALASGNVEHTIRNLRKAIGLTGWFQSRMANKFILKQAGITYLSLVGSAEESVKAEILHAADDVYVELLSLVDGDSSVEIAHIFDRRAIIAYYEKRPTIAKENWKSAIVRLSSAAATLGDAYNNMAVIDMSDGMWRDALPSLRIAEALGTGDVRTTQINQLICYAQLRNKADAEPIISRMEDSVRNLAEHAIHGMVYRDERSLTEYAKALGRSSLNRSDLSPELYEKLAKICRDAFWGLKFEGRQFEVEGENR